MAPCPVVAPSRRLGYLHRCPPTMCSRQYISARLPLPRLLKRPYLSPRPQARSRNSFEKDLLLLFLSPCFSSLLLAPKTMPIAKADNTKVSPASIKSDLAPVIGRSLPRSKGAKTGKDSRPLSIHSNPMKISDKF